MVLDREELCHLHYVIFYVNDLSVQLQKLPVGCCCGDMVVNHHIYADDVVLLAPSGKGMQTIIDATYTYGNAYDIVFNITKSQVMFYDTLKIDQAANIMLGDTVLSVAQTYTYLRPCSHCHSCAGTVPICRISRVCERAMSAIKLDLISEN